MSLWISWKEEEQPIKDENPPHIPHIFDPIIAAVKNRYDKTTRPWAESVRKYANKIANTLASSENIDQTIILDRDKEPFHIDISGWTVGKDIDGNKILFNAENDDVVEYLDWPYRWVQYFTREAAKRETMENGKKLM